MEQSDSWVTYWWVIVPVVALFYFVYVTLTRGASRPHQLALISLVLGVAGLLFFPLAPFAIFLGRKASAAGPRDASIKTMSRIAIVLGIIGSVFLAFAILIAGIYAYAYLTNQYP